VATQYDRTHGIAAALRIALLAGACLAFTDAALAGPLGDAEARAFAIQKLLDDGKASEGEVLAREALRLIEQEAGAETAATANICRLLGDALFSQKRYAEAEPYFRRSMAILEKVIGPNHLDVAQSASDLAITLRYLERHDEAEPLYSQAIAIRERLLGPEHGDVAKSWFRLSRLHDAKREYGKAAEALGHAVAIGEKAFGPNDRSVIQWTWEQAAELYDSGDASAAEPLYRKSIAAAERVLPSDDLKLATYRQGLATLLRHSDRAIEAEPLYRLVLAARERGLAADDPAIAVTLDGLAQSLDRLDEQAEAVPLYQRALAIRDQVDGADSRASAKLLSLLGRSLMGLDRAAEAEPLFRRMLAIYERIDGLESAGVAEAARWISHAVTRQNRDAEAEIFQKRALAISEKVHGPEHLLTAYDLLGLGLLYSGQQRLGEAEPLLTRALAIMEASDSKESASAARTALAFVKFGLGEREEAARLAERSLAEYTELRGLEDLGTVDMMATLAQFRLQLGDLAEAERLAVAAQEALDRKAPESRLLIRINSLLGSVRLAQGQPADALSLHEQALADLQQRYGVDNPETRTALSDVARAKFQLRDYAGAASYFERSIALTEKVAEIDAAIAFTNRTSKIEDEAIARGGAFDALVKSYDRLAEQQPAEREVSAEKSFRVAQRVIDSQAAAALSQMSARQAAGSGRISSTSGRAQIASSSIFVRWRRASAMPRRRRRSNASLPRPTPASWRSTGGSRSSSPILPSCRSRRFCRSPKCRLRSPRTRCSCSMPTRRRSARSPQRPIFGSCPNEAIRAGFALDARPPSFRPPCANCATGWESVRRRAARNH